MREVRELFALFDLNGDGSISKRVRAYRDFDYKNPGINFDLFLRNFYGYSMRISWCKLPLTKWLYILDILRN